MSTDIPTDTGSMGSGPDSDVPDGFEVVIRPTNPVQIIEVALADLGIGATPPEGGDLRIGLEVAGRTMMISPRTDRPALIASVTLWPAGATETRVLTFADVDAADIYGRLEWREDGQCLSRELLTTAICRGQVSGFLNQLMDDVIGLTASGETA